MYVPYALIFLKVLSDNFIQVPVTNLME